MPTTLFLAAWAIAVILCLYAFHCYWEAGREDLTAVTREHILQPIGAPRARHAGPSAGAYRVRGRVALATSMILAALVLFLAR